MCLFNFNKKKQAEQSESARKGDRSKNAKQSQGTRTHANHVGYMVRSSSPRIALYPMPHHQPQQRQSYHKSSSEAKYGGRLLHSSGKHKPLTQTDGFATTLCNVSRVHETDL